MPTAKHLAQHSDFNNSLIPWGFDQRFLNKTGLVQMRPLSGNSTDPQRPRRVQQVGKDRHELIPGERRVAEQGQPVWVGAARQQFRGAFPHTARVLTPHETAVVQKEL